ncbi:MAG: aminotransferase class V-fold PLP-dependent enzyme [Planctomycetota bacterium]
MGLLYLDTARLGQMTEGAQAAHRDFARLVGRIGASGLVEELLRSGYGRCKAQIDDEYPGLAPWLGLSEFKRQLRLQAGFRPDLPVLISSRSAVLMQFAARQIARRCRMILTTDLTWPAYHEIFLAECRRSGCESVCVHIGEDVLHRHEDPCYIADRLVSVYREMGCDGIFLTSVSSLGGRLPITKVVEQVRRECRFVVVDGAQDYCHVGMDVEDGIADLYLAGCHKWLGAYYPLGLAFFGRQETCQELEHAAKKDLEGYRDSLAADPLLQFLADFEQDRRRNTGETVNLSNLFGVAGALEDARRRGDIESRLRTRQRNADRLTSGLGSIGWDVRVPRGRLRSGVILLKPKKRYCFGTQSGESLRQKALQRGIALSAYDRGLVRLSMPDRPLEEATLNRIQKSFRDLLKQ